MRPGESPGLAKGYYLQRPESSLRAHGDRKEENYPQGDEGEKNERGRTRILSHLVKKNLGIEKAKNQLECFSSHSPKRQKG